MADNALMLGRDGEALTARDADDNLIAREAASRAKFEKRVTITLDGHEVSVPLSLPATDFLGNEIKEADGGLKPRTTTIYDAARQLVSDGVWTEEELHRRIPVLCHRDHLNPVAVCRMCSVHVSRFKKSTGKVEPSDRLVPACQHEVQKDMTVTTWCGQNEKYAKEVEKAISLLTELLVADHKHPDAKRDALHVNELQAVAGRLNVESPRQNISRHEGRNTKLHPQSRPLSLDVIDNQFPYSSRSITVDHDRCILCDRCVRSCSDVKPFKVIGHTGKGYNTRISFDLDRIQNDSSCVQCGECMNACPTGALTLKRRVAPMFEDAPRIPTDPAQPLPGGAGYLSASEMMAVELDYTHSSGEARKFKPFATIPFSYLKWNEGAVRHRVLEKGDVLCRFHEFGNTAFLLKSGRFEIVTYHPPKEEKPGFLGSLFGGGTKKNFTERGRFTVPASALILGELAALSNQRRTATIIAAERCEVYEVTRNVLDMAQRSPSARGVLAGIYTRNAISTSLRAGKLFEKLNNVQREVAESYLNTPITKTVNGKSEKIATRMVRVSPGEAIVREGDPAKDFYIIRSGFVKVVKAGTGGEDVLARLPATAGEKTVNYFGEIALLADHPSVAPLLTVAQREKRRTASVIALDPVEVIRVPGELFDGLCDAFPDVRELLAENCVETLQRPPAPNNRLREFLDQGLYQGQKLLVLDLQSCTRCDECTRACADSHSGVDHLSHGSGSVSRLLREGLRFGDFLVAASCRSCHKPYCMEGCPVDAIHRNGDRLEVQIDDHCIGCSLCEKNCPYGSIQMVPDHVSSDGTRSVAAVGRQAVNCDLCHDLVPDGADTFCVSACPHEAAFRWSGEKLLTAVG